MLRPPVFSALLVTACVLMGGCVPAATVEAGHPLTQAVMSGLKSGKSAFDHSAFTVLLRKHVAANSRVDYKSLKADRPQLQAYLARLAEADLARLGRDELMAFLINAYNAYTLDLILRNYPITSIKKISSPWDKNICELAGQRVSLNFIEHNLLRAPSLFGDPRIHFAVNCASIGCPPLRRDAFTGAKLEQQLDAATRDTLRDSRYLRVESGKVKVIRVFKWFEEDFVKKNGSVSRFLLPYVDGKAKALLGTGAEAAIEYLDYDWNLNDRNLNDKAK